MFDSFDTEEKDEREVFIAKDSSSENKGRAPYKHHLVSSMMALVALVMGIVKSLPLSIMLPKSLDLGLTTQQGALIIAAWPASSLLAVLLQPTLNRLPNRWYLTGTGIMCSLGFFSFYFAIHSGPYYLYLAAISRFFSGISCLLINNRAAVGLTTHFSGDINKSSTIWEMFNTAGMAAGASVGSIIQECLGFSLTMVLTGVIVIVNVGVLLCAHPGHKYIYEKDQTTKDMFMLHFSLEMIVYCWSITFCMGACMFFVEGNLTEYYRSVYFKSLAFGGALLGISGIVYSLAAGIIGLMRVKWPILTVLGLEVGLLGVAVTLLFIGPFVEIAGVNNITVSVTTFNLLLVSSAAVQLNATLVAANSLKNKVTGEVAMSVTMNVTNAAYNIGAFVGPLVGGGLLSYIPYKCVFAVGSPFFLSASLVVGSLAFYQRRHGIKLY